MDIANKYYGKSKRQEEISKICKYEGGEREGERMRIKTTKPRGIRVASKMPKN